MSLTKEQKTKVESYIIHAIAQQKKVPVNQKAIADYFGITKQSVSRIISKMEQSGRIVKYRDGRSNIYKLPTKIETYRYQIEGLTEDKVHNNIIIPFFRNTPENSRISLSYAFSEILNNAIEHSDGTEVEVVLAQDESRLFFKITDNGVGIFSKVANALNLDEKRYAILELAKGKFTTDPNSHSGEGIFFSSKCGDFFAIDSEGIQFVTESDIEILYEQSDSTFHKGTKVTFLISTAHKQTLKELFDQYTDVPEGYGFSKTVIPIRLLEHGENNPMFLSRSQARRLITRVEKFKTILLDFSNIDFIGQGFADEIFRVFKNNHPEIEILTMNCCEDVQKMINHVTKPT